MAAEAQAEGPGPVPVPPPPPARGSSSNASPEKRALPVPGDDGCGEEEEERRLLLPEPKRRRACVAALDGVPSAAADAGGPGPGGDADAAPSFSFQHARSGFVAPETTPKFGSFNPPEEDAEPAALDLKPAERGAGGEGRSVEEDGEVPSAPPRGAGVKGNDEVGGEVEGQVQT